MEVRIAGKGIAEGVEGLSSCGEYRYRIPSFTTSRKAYVVDVVAGYCSCPHHRIRSAFCKHLRLASEVASYERLADELRLAEDVVTRERRAASGFRSGVGSEYLDAVTAARDALREYVVARMVRGCFVPGMPPAEAPASKEVAA